MLDKIKKGDMLLYKKKSCVVLFRFRKEIIRDIYKSEHPVFRVQFADGHKMCVSERNAADFSIPDIETYDPESEDDCLSDDRETLRHYEEIADSMR